PPAAGAGDEVEGAAADAEGLQDGLGGLDLLDGVGRERDAQGVADALRQQGADADGGLHQSGGGRAGLGHPQVQGVGGGGGQQAVGGDHLGDVLVLDRDLDVREALVLQDRHLGQGGLHQGLGGGAAVAGEQP